MTELKEAQIAEEHRRILVNEYCRNAGNIKIKCDDCKFVADCVDYGWEDCKKFTPAPSEPMTNEEYIKSLNTEQLAEWIVYILYDKEFKKHIDKIGYINTHSPKTEVTEWLKQSRILNEI